ncbi:MAG: nuclear transport factor 2 family protein [Caulobacteraceae bacterium]|nr:nuclear transport factor 2 family protein [Caulobacteraceae bacterium]
MRQDAQALSEIRTLLAAYNVAGDRMRLEALAATFTPAGVLETPTAVLRGREEIARGLAGGSRRDGPAPTLVRHHLTTSHVELQEADQAEARTYFIVYTEIGPDHAATIWIGSRRPPRAGGSNIAACAWTGWRTPPCFPHSSPASRRGVADAGARSQIPPRTGSIT